MTRSIQTRKRRPVLIWVIAVFFGVACPVLVAMAITKMHASEAALESAHLQGMSTGFTMCGAR